MGTEGISRFRLMGTLLLLAMTTIIRMVWAPYIYTNTTGLAGSKKAMVYMLKT